MISNKAKLTVILLGLSAISMPVFAGLDTIVQRVGESLRPKESFENLNKGFSFGNIYTNAHNIATKEFLATTAQALGNMTNDLNYTYSCDLDINQVSNILLSIDSSRNDIQAMAKVVQQETPILEQDSFISSCIKLVSCATKANNGAKMYSTGENGQRDVALSDDGFLNCKRLATNAYNRNVLSTQSSVTLASTNAGNDIYYNGTLDDSPYDILVDIQRIGDVLFEGNEQTEKILFYTFPNNSIAGFQAIPFDGSSRLTSLPNTSIGGNTANNQGSLINTAGNNITNSSTTFPSTNSNQGGYNNTTPIYVDTTNTATNGGIIDNYACTTITQGGNGGIGIGPITGNNQTGYTISNTGFIQNGGTSYTPPIFDINTPYYSPVVGSTDDPAINSQGWEDPEQYEQQASQITACTSKCNGLKSIDKSMCIAKCMCGTTYTKNGMFGLSICTVSTKQTDVVGSKSVQSIEEIVSEINNVLKNLKQSGEMIKHTKPTEFLETSLSKIQLNKIFAFDVSISFKPILDIKPRKMSDAEAENETDQLLKGTYGSIDIGAEKNKYAVFGITSKKELIDNTSNITLEEIERTITNESLQYTSKYNTINTNTSNILATSQNAEVADIVRQFLEQNVRFWTYIHDSLDQVQQTASQIRQKIEKK